MLSMRRLIRVLLLGLLSLSFFTFSFMGQNKVSAHKGVVAPDLTITDTHYGHAAFAHNQKVIYRLSVSNRARAGVVPQPTSIDVTFNIPAGLRQITAVGKYWQIMLDQSSSPAMLSAKYIGKNPVQPGDVLPTIKVSGYLTARISFTTTAIVATPGDRDLTNNVASDVLAMLPTAGSIPVSPVPDLAITDMHHGYSTFVDNQEVLYRLSVSNKAKVGVVRPDAIDVTFNIPAGLRQITAAGKYWQIMLDQSTGPATLSAKYVGKTPVQPGEVLPTIKVRGFLTASISFTTTAIVATPGDSDITNNVASDVLAILPTEAPTPVVTETPTPVATETPTPIATETPTPVVTETPTPVVTETPPGLPL